MAFTLAPSADVTTLDLPSLALGLGGGADWETPRFINRAKQSRGWNNGSTAYNDIQGNLINGGGDSPYIHIHSDGNANTAYRGGTFRVTWDGSGEIITTFGSISNKSGNTSGLTLDLDSTGGNTWLNFSNVNWENPPRNLAVVRVDQIAAYEAGQIFDPDFVSAISGFDTFRFMDWQGTNGHPIANWSDRSLLSWQRWNESTGFPLEALIALCNQTNTNAWFCIPHMADDEYITNFVQIVYDTLNPNLVARFEYSNETWNDAIQFWQTKFCRRKAWATWAGPLGWSWNPALAGDYYDPWKNAGANWDTTPLVIGGSTFNDDNYNPALNGGYDIGVSANLDWSARRSTRMAQIVRSIFGTSRRAKCVLCLQSIGSGSLNSITASKWQTYDSENYINPATLHDEMGITTYWGGSILSTYDDEIAAELTNNGQAAAVAYMATLTDAACDDKIATINLLAETARTNGLNLVAYEGNQHVVNYGPALVSGFDPTPEALAAVEALTYGSEIATQQTKMLNAFRAAGGTLCCMFVAIMRFSKFGAWGLRRYRTDTNPVWTAVVDWQGANARWWPK